MCTVTYIPIAKDDFVFTSNRDEAPRRAAAELAIQNINGKQVCFPKDQKAHGTWIAIADSDQLVCILNGAFEKHKHSPPYKKSRGIMALEFFKYPSAEDFRQQYDFSGIEPFTLVIYDRSRLFELRWDEELVHFVELVNNQKHLWASCTLYDAYWQQKRKEWFEDWQNKISNPSQQDIIDFHKNGGEGNPTFDLVMNWQNKVRTTSVTSIVKSKNSMSLRYEHLLNGLVLENQLHF